MICIYEKTETSFTYNGLGTLEPTYCSYSPYINDVWKLEMYLPYDPEGKYKLVENGKILKVTGIDCIQEQTSDYQLFSIETYRKEGNSIYVLAYPVGMDARFDTYANQINANYKTAAQAISLINGVKAITLDNQQIDKYTVSTDISAADLNSAVWNNTNIIAMLTNDENGFIHRWGGEVCYDNYNIKVNQALGRTSGASEVRYGKNIRGMSYEEDTSNVITRLYPVANGGETLNAIEEYKIADTQYVDSANVSDYPIPHIAYTNAPFNLVQMSDDGSANYAVTFAAYELIRDTAANWLNDALLGENTGGVDGLLVDIELAWFVDNYALTLANDGTQGLAEYVTNNICNDGLNPIHSASVKNLIYEAVKAGFELVLKDDTSAAYVGPASKKMWDGSMGADYYTYTWDSAGDYRVNKNGDADYAWVYASNKWHQLNDDGYATGTVDTAKWKWYKVSGKSFKRYGNKNKKRYLKNQWWNISGVWYLFGSDGKGKSGAELQESCYEDFDVTYVNDKTIYEVLSPICKEMESDLFDILYSQMTDYCTNMFTTEKISFPTPSISIDMVDLSKTVEYAGYTNLLKVKLGDTVKCVNTKLNISTDLRITGLTYDVLKGCNTSIQIGLTETSIISEFDKPVNTDLLAKQGLIAGHGIRIVGNVISTTGTNLTDVVVGGQSVVYGGKAYIDIDEISGEGLQWFEETEDALFGVVDEMALVKDPMFKTATAGGTALLTQLNGDSVVSVTINGGDNTVMMYYPSSYYTKSPYIFGGVLNKGYILVLSKTNTVTVHTQISSAGNDTIYSDYQMYGLVNGDQIGYIINPETGEPIYNYIGTWAYAGSANVDGETWYGMLIGQDDWLGSGFRSLTTYLPVADYPVGEQGIAYADMSEMIQATVPLSRSVDSGNYNGISREGNLAFFAGADDEHGTNAPIKIYRDGTYEGIGGLVDDVKVNNVTVVEDRVANINLSDYGLQKELHPRQGIVIDELNNIYSGSENTDDLPLELTDWDTYVQSSMTIQYIYVSSLESYAMSFSYGAGNAVYSKAVYTIPISKEVEYIDFDITRGIGSFGDTRDSYFFLREELWTGYVDITDLITGNLAFSEISTAQLPIEGDSTTVRLNCSNVNVDSYLYIYDTGWSMYVSGIHVHERKADVIANPDGQATESLSKLEVEGTIYSVDVGASELNELSDVNISSPTNAQVLKYNSSTQKWENANESGGGGGGGNSITHGYANPSALANENDVYYLLNSSDDKLKGTFLYMSNSWVLIQGKANLGNIAVRVWTQSTGGADASLWVQKGHMESGVYVADETAISVSYQDIANTETTYYDLISLVYNTGTYAYSLMAKEDGLTDGTNTYDTDDVISTWAYYDSIDTVIYPIP